jgi:Ca-activated chloride channel family protein
VIGFDAPGVLYAAPLVAGMLMGLAWWARGARLRHAARWSRELLVLARGVNRWSAWLVGGVVLAVMLALAGPRWGRRTIVTQSKALNMAIAVDVSRSMLAEDATPSRLKRAQREARRLVQDLSGDRIGLLAFAGRSFILSPLTVDGGALQLLVDGLDPEMTSAGGTALAQTLQQGREMLLASTEVADRVLVVFTDGETWDSMPEVLASARALKRDGIHLIMVAEGGRTPVRIPERDENGVVRGYHQDGDGVTVITARQDEVLTGVADAAEGALVAAGLTDQAGAVRELVSAYKRAPTASTTAADQVSRAWIPLLLAVLMLVTHTLTRRTAALACLLLALTLPAGARAQTPKNAGDAAWRDGSWSGAVAAYLAQARRGEGGDTAFLNAGTAALALGDTGLARSALERGAQSLDPEVRYRSLYNLGLLALQRAAADKAHSDAFLAEARERYREALLLRPKSANAKWNLELAVRRTPPASGGGGQQQQPPPPPQGSSGGRGAPPPPNSGLTAQQAAEILNSIASEEAATRASLQRRRGRPTERRGVRDW